VVGAPETVEEGDDFTFTIELAKNYLVTRVIVNMVELVADEAGVYTVENVTSDVNFLIDVVYDNSDDLPIIYEEFTVLFVDYDNTILASQRVKAGQAATAPAAPERTGYTFTGWSQAFDNVTKDMIVVAEYSKKPAPPVEAPKTGILKIDISGGTSFTLNDRPQGTSYYNTQMDINKEVTVVANATNGNEFIGWVLAANYEFVSKDPEFTFTTTGNDSYKALFKADIDGVQAVIFKNEKLGGGSGQILDMRYYSATEAINRPADTFASGYIFKGWKLEGDTTNTEVTDAMIQAQIAKGEDVTLVPIWEKEIVYVTLTVNGGTGGGQVLANYATRVTANPAPAGQKFAYWTDDKGNVKSYSESYIIYPRADMELTAVFVPEDENVVEQILVSMDSAEINTTLKGLKFNFSWHVPSEYSFKTAGIVAIDKVNYVESTFYAGSTATGIYTRYPSAEYNTSTNSYGWSKSNVADGATWVAKAFIQYTDASGNPVTVYSDVFEFTKTEYGVEVK